MNRPENAAEFDSNSDDVFGRIAERYDLLCDIFSIYSHRRWKERLAEAVVRTEGRDFLDIASGTGHIVHRVMRKLGADRGLPRKNILATDLSPKMLDVARRKDEFGYDPITYSVENAYDMKSVATASIDVISLSFAMKITDRAKVLKEVARMLKPGGVFYCLEASRIPFEPLYRVYLAYMNLCVPLMAGLATGGDRSAYDYLLRGIHNFPTQEGLASEIADHGFHNVTWQNLSFGIVALHRAVRR